MDKLSESFFASPPYLGLGDLYFSTRSYFFVRRVCPILLLFGLRRPEFSNPPPYFFARRVVECAPPPAPPVGGVILQYQEPAEAPSRIYKFEFPISPYLGPGKLGFPAPSYSCVRNVFPNLLLFGLRRAGFPNPLLFLRPKCFPQPPLIWAQASWVFQPPLIFVSEIFFPSPPYFHPG